MFYFGMIMIMDGSGYNDEAVDGYIPKSILIKFLGNVHPVWISAGTAFGKADPFPTILFYPGLGNRKRSPSLRLDSGICPPPGTHLTPRVNESVAVFLIASMKGDMGPVTIRPSSQP